ncbi:hypothetical protein Bbelb_126310 [Branchiostoma belcheri]|nr:hypothetical protein Bbelb_126310 [Branchiostoma belcheri]
MNPPSAQDREGRQVAAAREQSYLKPRYKPIARDQQTDSRGTRRWQDVGIAVYSFWFGCADKLPFPVHPITTKLPRGVDKDGVHIDFPMTKNRYIEEIRLENQHL